MLTGNETQEKETKGTQKHSFLLKHCVACKVFAMVSSSFLLFDDIIKQKFFLVSSKDETLPANNVWGGQKKIKNSEKIKIMLRNQSNNIFFCWPTKFFQ